MKGSEFFTSIQHLGPGAARNAAILDAVRSGNVYHGDWCDVPYEDGTIQVSCDYVSIGTPDDFYRIPADAPTSQAIADEFGAMLPTSRISDLIHQAADIRLQPVGLVQSEADMAKMQTEAYGLKSHQAIEKQRAGRLGLISGAKKDVVISNRVLQKPGTVAIYGWHHPNGKAIQSIGTPDKASTAHHAGYYDYSHGVRLVRTHDGAGVPLASILSSPTEDSLTYAPPLHFLRYPILPIDDPPSPPPPPPPATGHNTGGVSHADAREIIRQAWPGDVPNWRALQIGQAVGLAESSYAAGFGRGRHNWGAVQCNTLPPCPAGCFEWEPVGRCFREYASDIEGASDMLRIILKREGAEQAMREGNIDAFVVAMGTPPVYSELAWKQPAKYKEWLRSHMSVIASALGEPMADEKTTPLPPPFCPGRQRRPKGQGPVR